MGGSTGGSGVDKTDASFEEVEEALNDDDELSGEDNDNEDPNYEGFTDNEVDSDSDEELLAARHLRK